MKTFRTIIVLASLATLLASSGCATAAKGLLNGLVDTVYQSQFNDGRGADGLTRADERARFEESSIRFSLRERAYSEEGRVPGAP